MFSDVLSFCPYIIKEDANWSLIMESIAVKNFDTVNIGSPRAPSQLKSLWCHWIRWDRGPNDLGRTLDYDAFGRCDVRYFLCLSNEIKAQKTR